MKMVLKFIAEVGEFGLKVLIGEGARVFEIAQAFIAEYKEVTIRDDVFERAAAFVGFAVLGAGEPTKQILRGIVERIIDEVVTLTEIGFAFAVGEGRSLTVEDLAHEDVA